MGQVCSSCSLSSCGIEACESKMLLGVKAAWPLSGGTNRLAPHLAAAYGLRDSKGRKWALKLGDQEDGGYDSSVEASQLAHRLEIYTPRVLQITEASCPGVFKSPALEEAVEEFRKSRHTALLQELVEDELPCSTSRSFWVQAGNIAMFDWLTGRNDLFNDLLKDGVAAMADNLETNQDNVVETPSHLAEIDLGFGTPCCLQDFQQILRELQEGRGHVAWVQSNVLVLLCEGKHGGLGSGSCASHFGQYNAHALRPKAWDGRLSRTQIDLGMAQTAWQALQLQGSDGWPFPNSTMDMLKRWGRRTAQDVAERLQKQEASILAELRAEKQQCCQLHCEYQGVSNHPRGLSGLHGIAMNERLPLLYRSESNSNGPPNGPSTLYEIKSHGTSKRTLEKGFDARHNFVHFAPSGLKNVVPLQELMERPGVRNFLYRSKWYQKPSVVHLRSFMRGTAISIWSFISLLIALFCGDLFALLSVPGNTLCDAILTAAFVFFVLEFLGNALSDRTYPLSFFFYMDLIGTFSMVFDISYMCGPDATALERLQSSGGGGGGVIVMRAARAARIGARAGRLSRVAKIVRFLSGSEVEEQRNVRMAKVISNKLSDVLSIRVAFVVICIAVVLPSLSIFEYPAMEESMTAWTTFLASEAQEYAQGSRSEEATAKLDGALSRLAAFYSTTNYGPFMACYHEKPYPGGPEEELEGCGDGASSLRLGEEAFRNFSQPKRQEFILVTSVQHLDIFFDLAAPKRLEALMGISLIMFIILVMIIFSTILSENISTVALLPLERMLDVVRQRCAQIFRYTDELQEEEEEDEDAAEAEADEEHKDEEAEQDNEFALLEKAVAKLGAIASLSTKNIVKEDIVTEDDLMVQGWSQGIRSTRNDPVESTDLKMRISNLVAAEDATFMTSLYKQVPSEMLELSRTLHFNATTPSRSENLAICAITLRDHVGSKTFAHSVKPMKLVKFVTAAEKRYLPTPFHNFSHALDVACSLSLQMTQVQADVFMSDLSQFALLVAAVGHDMGHEGLNNTFLVETSHELAVTYNDKSPLENMHCSKLFQLLRDPETDVFSSVAKDQYKEVREDIIQAILHTDVTKHNEMVKDLALFYQMNKETLNIEELAEEAGGVLKASRTTMINALLHSADVNNPCKPWEVAKQLAYSCMDEFFAQGDMEKSLGIPVGFLNDREKVNRANSQIGFIEFMIAPFVEALVLIFPPLQQMSIYTAENVQRWARVWREEANPQEQEKEKMAARVQKVVARLNATLQAGPSSPRGLT
ncbi:unnamed protein product [Effrenium voratum]|nr:unnamed protein product [Effrenium voratum]